MPIGADIAFKFVVNDKLMLAPHYELVRDANGVEMNYFKASQQACLPAFVSCLFYLFSIASLCVDTLPLSLSRCCPTNLDIISSYLGGICKIENQNTCAFALRCFALSCLALQVEKPRDASFSSVNSASLGDDTTFHTAAAAAAGGGIYPLLPDDAAAALERRRKAAAAGGVLGGGGSGGDEVKTLPPRISGVFEGVKRLTDDMRRKLFESDWKKIQVLDLVRSKQERNDVKVRMDACTHVCTYAQTRTRASGRREQAGVFFLSFFCLSDLSAGLGRSCVLLFPGSNSAGFVLRRYCPVIPCLVLSCPVLSCPVLPL